MADTCSSCQHWRRRNAENEYYALEEDTPAARAEYERWGFCEMAESDGEKPVVTTTLAIARDYESYKASLLTNEQFGCIQWMNRG